MQPPATTYSPIPTFSRFRRWLIFFLDALFVTRPVLWIPVWAFAVFGYFRSLRLGLDASYRVLWHLRWAGDAGWIAVFSCSVGAVYVVNQFADMRVDRANAGFPLLARGRVSAAAAWGALWACACCSVLTPLAGRPIVALFSLAALVIGAVYSLPPASLSGRPFADFLTNAVGFGVVAFGAGWALSPAELPLVSIRFAAAAVPYVLLMCAGSISSTIPDIPGDRACGKRTTAVALGFFPAHLLAAGCVALGAIVAGSMRDWLALTGALAAMPWYLASLVLPRPALIEASYKGGGAVLMCVAAAIAPLFACAAGIVYLGTWMYFRWRYGVTYPSLQPAQSAKCAASKRGRCNDGENA